MLFEQIATGGCQSYLVGCEATCAAVLIDPEIRQLDRYHAHAARDGLRIRYVVDTHTHADHFSAAHHFGQTAGIPVVMHRDSPAPFADMRLDDGDILAVGNLRLTAMHTPGHTRDSMCLRLEDRIFTGDTLLIGATGRTDLPTGDPEALRTNMSGGKTVAQLLAEAAAKTPFMSLDELRARVERKEPMIVLDVREKDAYQAGHVPGARHLPRGQLELRVNDELPDPTLRILTVCEFGKISTLAAASLRDLGFMRAAALDGGMKAWRDAGYPLTAVTGTSGPRTGGVC